MIAYHGTPISGNAVEIARFLKGRHALVSFAAQQDIAVVAEACASFVLDNGAFSMWTRGVPPDWDAYYRWVEEWQHHPGYDWHLIPDVIDGTEDDNWRLMFQYGRRSPGAVPVYHMHESEYHLERLTDQYDRIAIGSSGQWPTPGTKSWWERMAWVMSIVCRPDGSPRCKLHGLRMLNPMVFRDLPLSSADSCNCGVNCGNTDRWNGYTKKLPSSQKAEILAWRIEHHNSANVWDALTAHALRR